MDGRIGSLRWRYRLALGLVALLSISAFTGLTLLLDQQAGDAPVVDKAGRQRMLSQRVAAFVNIALDAQTPQARQAALEELNKAIDLMESSHQELAFGDAEAGLPGAELGTPIHALYFGETALDATVSQFVADARAAAGDSPDAEAIQRVQAAAAGPLLRDLNEAVTLYVEASSARTEVLHRVEAFLMGSTLLLLLLEALFIFRPATGALAKSLQELDEEHANVVASERRVRLLLDATADGLMPVDLQGQITSGWAACLAEWFDGFEEGRPFWQVISEDEDVQLTLELAFDQIATDFLPFEVAVEMAPRRVTRGERTFGLSFREILNDGERVGILLVVRDQTEQVAQELENELRAEQLATFEVWTKDPRGFARFVDNTTQEIQSLDVDDPMVLARDLHTIKGNVGLFGFHRFARVVHHLESDLAAGAEPAPGIHALQERWTQTLSELPAVQDSESTVELFHVEYERHLQALGERVPYEVLVEQVRRWQFEPCEPQLERLAQTAERIADKLGKQVQVSCRADDVRLPPEVAAPYWDALVHLVRNAMDHGLETPEARVAAGKPKTGSLRLEVRERPDQVHFLIQDDGGGIDWARLREKAAEAGVEAPAEEGELLFLDGLTSKEEASEYSGRGVGMAAVRSMVRDVGGDLSVASKRGRGTCITLRMPVAQRAAA